MAEGTSQPLKTAVDEARELLGQNRAAEAAAVLQDHLTRRPGTAGEYMLLGVALAQAGEGLTAIQALEQAVAMEPGNAAAQYNLGQVYRQGGRQREALEAFERALQLRPHYPAARAAAAELRRQAAPPPADVVAASPRPARRSADPFGPFGAPAAAPPPAPVKEEGGVYRRLWAAMWQLIISPGEAVNYGLDNFFNTRGAMGAVFNLFSLGVIMSVLVAWLLPAGDGGTEAGDLMSSIPFVILISVVNVIATAGAIATYNRLTGGSDDFIGDFGSLAMSFAMIAGTITLLTAPVQILMALAGAASGAGLLFLIAGLWTLVLRVMLVMAATDIGALAAYFLLGAASFVAWIVTAMVAVVFVAAGG